MYLAMSRLKIKIGKESEFEKAWKNREQNTDGIKGFKQYNLFKSDRNKEYSLYIFHSEWNSERDFINWTKSDSFQFVHKNPVSQNNLFLGPPDFDGYIEFPSFEGLKVVI
jgi:heme-degrading monooxygenase HmoA